MVLLPSECGGVLIQPRVVATAAHCLLDADGRLQAATAALFGERQDEPQLNVGVSICFRVEPEQGDFAVCVLEAEARGVPIVPAMAPCEADWLAPGKTAVEVGFGDGSSDEPYSGGIKRWLEATLVHTREDSPYLEVSTGTQAGEYYGDSGSPLFFQMPDETWRVIGTASGSPDIVPGSTAPRFSAYANVPYFMAWAEQAIDIDLTPCHDAEGWNPGPRCGSLPVASGAALDTWGSKCRQVPTARPGPSCAPSPLPRADLRAAGGCSQTPRASSRGWGVALVLTLLGLAGRRWR